MKKVIIIIIIYTISILFLKAILINIRDLVSYVRIKISQNQLCKYKQFPQKNTVNIVAITDANFITPLNVAIYSAIKNKNASSKYNFFIVGIDLSKDNIKELSKQSTEETPITIIQNKNIYSFYTPKNINFHVPVTDCFKFDLPNLFPNFDKMLYLDGDVIVQKDLSDLYNLNIENYYAGASFNNDSIGKKLLGLEKCFNNGVILLNLKKMRKDNIPDKMLAYKIFKSPKRYVTQDTFNVILKSKVKELDNTYNTSPNFIVINKDSDIENFLKTRAIIHFAGPCKPWKSQFVLYGSTWEKYHQELEKKYSQIMPVQ